MSLTRANRNFPAKVGRRVPPACSFHQCAVIENVTSNLSSILHPPSSLAAALPRHVRPALSLREEGFGACQRNRLLRSQVVGRTFQALPSPSQAKRRTPGRRRLNPCMNLQLKTSKPQNTVKASRPPIYSRRADDFSLSPGKRAGVWASVNPINSLTARVVRLSYCAKHSFCLTGRESMMLASKSLAHCAAKPRIVPVPRRSEFIPLQSRTFQPCKTSRTTEAAQVQADSSPPLRPVLGLENTRSAPLEIQSAPKKGIYFKKTC